MAVAGADAIELRGARASDRQRLAEMWTALVEHHRQLDPGYPVPPGLRAALNQEIERGLARPSCRIALACRGGHAVGFIFCEVATESRHGDGEYSGWVHELWVEPPARRGGVASALVECARAFFRERDATRAGVRVEASNPAALAFWRKLGFAPRAHVLELRDAAADR
jgi:GNAT superfamily N-acetyltransferase